MPGLVINTNVPSINGQRNLHKSTLALNKAMERLSSGLRINRAGDDAAGLAISENLRTRIRGLNQAVRNADDGISLIQTAEGAIDTYTEISQRIRQLAVQASSDVNSDDNRASIQLEINEQLDELDRIAKTMDFNGQPLFDGTFINKRIQVGAKAGETMEISVGDLRTDVIGGVAQVIGVALDGSTATGGMSDGDILVNNVAVPSSASPSARDKAIAINSVYYQTGVYARAEAAQTIATAAVGAGTLDLAVGDTLTINGYTLPREGTLVVAANDATGTLRRAINAVSHETGVAADIDATTGALVLTATNDEDFTYTMDTATTLGIVNLTGAAGVQETVFGRLRLYSDQAFTVADGTGTALTLIGITGSYGLDPTSVIETVDVTSFAKAQESLLKIDNALRQINDVRSGLGAITNRLENTVANMMISAENLSASDSRIRDADFAAETANMTRAQILQQSGVAVLAQANLTPQTALSLLK